LHIRSSLPTTVVHAEGTRRIYAVDTCGIGRVAIRYADCSTPQAIGSVLGGLGRCGTIEDSFMSDIREAQKALVRRILEGDGKASPSERRAAFNNTGLPEPLSALVDKVAKHAYTVTDEDVTAAKVSGLSEDQVFEIAVCAAVGQATRQYETALAALKDVTGKE
jgi:hypothetical protein